MKAKAINWLLKALLAGAAAFVLLCLFCALWYKVPVHYTNPDGATEYKYEPNTFYSRGVEGFAMGRTNGDGYPELLDYAPGDQVDVLLLGSSHLEGYSVPPEKNAAAVLGRLFDGEKAVYSIAMAGHTFPYCAKHLEKALEVYRPQIAVIELASLSYDPAAMDAVTDGTLPDIPSHAGGFVTLLQKLPFLRHMYNKYFNRGNDVVKAAAVMETEVSGADFDASLARLLEKLGEVSRAHGVKTILVHVPTVVPDAEGRAVLEVKPGERESFQRLSEENGLVFLDLTERFVSALEDDHELLFGFANTAPGHGHINSRGHELFAEAVYDCIENGEG